jgi:hypothetical protein
MKKEWIVVSSVTHAMRGREVLERAGFRVQITRLPRGIENTGCGYCLAVDRDTGRAEALLREKGIRVLTRYTPD